MEYSEKTESASKMGGSVDLCGKFTDRAVRRAEVGTGPKRASTFVAASLLGHAVCVGQAVVTAFLAKASSAVPGPGSLQASMRSSRKMRRATAVERPGLSETDASVGSPLHQEPVALANLFVLSNLIVTQEWVPSERPAVRLTRVSSWTGLRSAIPPPGPIERII